MITYSKATADDIFLALSSWFRIWDEFIVHKEPAKDCDYSEITQKSDLLKKYESGERLMIIAKDGEKIVGAIGASINENSVKPPLCVDSKYHNQGIATELLHRMVCELKLAGCDLIKVDSSSYALPFYKKFGFIQIGLEQQHDGFVSIPMEYVPNEIWDVLDKNGNKTGRFHERGRKLTTGDYHLVVQVWKHNGKGEWLIDKRVPQRGGKWETTVGSAVAGDDSLTAALRESKEELGLDLDPAKAVLFHHDIRYGDDGQTWLQDAWVFEHDCSLDDVQFQENETCDAMWAPADKIRQMMATGEFLSESFYPYFDEMIEKWG